MQTKNNPRSDKKVVIRHAPNALKIALILLILFSIAALFTMRWVHRGILEETQKLTEEAAGLEQANRELEEKAEQIDSVEGIQDAARDDLGLVDPDTILIDPQ